MRKTLCSMTLLSLFLALAGCSSSSSTKTAAEKFNPYTGEVKDLMPEQISSGQEKWNRKDLNSTTKPSVMMPDEISLTSATYVRPAANIEEKQFSYTLTIDNFKSAEAADRKFKELEKSYKTVTPVPKKIGDQVVGMELVDDRIPVRIWIHGSLIVAISGGGNNGPGEIKKIAAALPY